MSTPDKRPVVDGPSLSRPEAILAPARLKDGPGESIAACPGLVRPGYSPVKSANHS